jgi:NIPSNAP
MPLNEKIPALDIPRNLPAAISTTGAKPASAVAISFAILSPPAVSKPEPSPKVLPPPPAGRYDDHRAAPPKEKCEMAFYELRQYKVRPGKIDEWVKIMEEEIIPFQVSKGMVICGSFRGETDPSVYVWLRRFESEAERETLYKAVYESDHWKTKIAPRVPDCLDRSAMVVTRIVPTAKSTMR